jgi:hypothetical protein
VDDHQETGLAVIHVQAFDRFEVLFLVDAFPPTCDHPKQTVAPLYQLAAIHDLAFACSSWGVRSAGFFRRHCFVYSYDLIEH